jgi:hypothetical protein
MCDMTRSKNHHRGIEQKQQMLSAVFLSELLYY